MTTMWPNKFAGADRRWRLQFRCRGSRHEPEVAQLFSLGHLATLEIYDTSCHRGSFRIHR